MKTFIKNIPGFFPVRLFFLHFRRNQLLLLFWIFLFAIITGNFGTKYGVQYLFWVPEYLNKVNIFSYFILGLTSGIFIIAYQISSYLTNGYLFPFMATLLHPFAKYSLNNFIIPVLFVIVFIYYSIVFQINEELLSVFSVFFNILSFLAGILIMIIISFSWFFTMNTDIVKLTEAGKVKTPKNKRWKAIGLLLDKDIKWKMSNMPQENEKQHEVKIYLSTPFKARRARHYKHFESENIQRVLRHNNISSAVFSWLVLLSTVVLGLFKDYYFMLMPAAGSLLLLLSLLLLFSATIYAVFKEWSIVAFIIFIFSLNFMAGHSGFDYHNSAYGLNYSVNQDIEECITCTENEKYTKDFNAMIDILNKRKNNLQTGKEKLPKLVIVNAGGGGLKAAVWTYFSLHKADSVCEGKLLPSIHLISGASGGMLGASYLRELYIQEKAGKIKSWYNTKYINKLSDDILNPIGFALVSGAWFFRFQEFEYSGKKYYKDRAYMFEKTLNKNTDYVFDKTISKYKEPEKTGEIPMLIFSSTIANDGRKLLISPQKLSFFEKSNKFSFKPKIKNSVNIDFMTGYENFDVDSLRYSTAIRMSATFPYISPYISLPGKEKLQLFDAGAHDNYGISTSLEFVSIFEKWILKNTSGIIFLQIVNRNKEQDDNSNDFISDIFRPFQGSVGNYFNFQQINFEKQFRQMSPRLQEQIDFVNLYLTSEKQEISISWHLTESEKQEIKKAIDSPANKFALQKLKILLDNR